jgi:hypothetical protein
MFKNILLSLTLSLLIVGCNSGQKQPDIKTVVEAKKTIKNTTFEITPKSDTSFFEKDKTYKVKISEEGNRYRIIDSKFNQTIYEGVLDSYNTEKNEGYISLNDPNIGIAKLTLIFTDKEVGKYILEEDNLKEEGKFSFIKDNEPFDTTILLQNFADQKIENADLNKKYNFNVISIQGLEGKVLTVYLQGDGELIKNNNILNGKTTTVVDGDSLQVRLRSHENFNSITETKLKLGNSIKSFSIKTKIKKDIVSDLYLGENKENLDPKEVVLSKVVKIQDINVELPVVLTTNPENANVKIIKNGLTLNTKITTVKNGDTLQLKIVASDNLEEKIQTFLKVGTLESQLNISTKKIDSSLDNFNLTTTPIYDAEPNQEFLTDTIQISGINTEIEASITKGYIIKNGVNEGTKTTVKEGDNIQIKLNASSKYSTKVEATLKIGNYYKTYQITTKGKKYIPTNITLGENKTNLEPSKIFLSNAIKIENINVELPVILTTNPENANVKIIKNGKTLSSRTTTVKNGDILQLKAFSSNNLGETVNIVLKVGEIESSLSLTTKEKDSLPDNIELGENIVAADYDKKYKTEVFRISGVNTNIPLEIKYGTIIKNNIPLKDKKTTVKNGDLIQIEMSSSSLPNRKIENIITIGDLKKTFSITTKNKDNLIDEFKVNNIYQAEPNQYYTFNKVLISGLNVKVPVSITNGILIKNDIELAEKDTMVENGDTIQVKLKSAKVINTDTFTELTIGGAQKELILRTKASFFNNVVMAELNTPYFSNGVEIYEDNTSIKIENGTLFLNNKEIPEKEISAKKGDKVKIKIISANSLEESVTATIIINDIIDTFIVRTKKNYSFVNEDDLLENGKRYENIGTQYFYINLPNNGNIDFTGYNSSAYIFDINMNPIFVFRADDANHSIANLQYFQKGKYIAKLSTYLKTPEFKFDSYVYVYSSFLEINNQFEILKNGQYEKEGLSFYHVKIPLSGSFNFTLNKAELSLYDSGMKKIFSITENDTKDIAEGNYILKINNKEEDSYVTIFSPTLN